MKTLTSATVTTLKWPVLSLLVTGGMHFMLEAFEPDLRTLFVPAALAPLLIAYGAWAGYRAVTGGGNLGHAVLAAAILGLMPLALDIVGFGIILDRGTHVGLLSGLFGFSFIVFGGLVGGGFASSGRGVSAARLTRAA